MSERKPLVRLYPTADASIPGVPAEVMDVSPHKADELLAYQPPAFTTKPPQDAPEPPPAEEPA